MKVLMTGSPSMFTIDKRAENFIMAAAERGLEIITGANWGAEEAIQEILHVLDYPNVTIYHTGDAPRVNISGWLPFKVEDLKGVNNKDMQAVKDKAMIDIADIGLILWDTRTASVEETIKTMADQKKKCMVLVEADQYIPTFKYMINNIGMNGEEHIKEIIKRANWITGESLNGSYNYNDSYYYDDYYGYIDSDNKVKMRY